MIQQTTLPTHLLAKSIFVIVNAIHLGISLGIGPEPPLLSAIISSEISSFMGLISFFGFWELWFLGINKFYKKKLKRTIKSASVMIIFYLNTTLMFLREPFLA